VLCSHVEVYRRFGGESCPHHQGDKIHWVIFDRNSCISKLLWSIYASEMWKLQSANNVVDCISCDDCGRTAKQVQFRVRLCRRRTELNSRVSSLPRPSYHHGNTQPPQRALSPRSKHVHFPVIMLKWKRLRSFRFASLVTLQNQKQEQPGRWKEFTDAGNCYTIPYPYTKFRNSKYSEIRKFFRTPRHLMEGSWS
jgi:hypothetical protein